MSLRRGRARAELMGDINVVSLIDVMMLLLVIFMITAPIMQGGVDVTLPSAKAQPLTPKSGITISVSPDKIYLDGVGYSDRAFRASVKTLVGSRSKDGVYVAGDMNATYQRILSVLDMLRTAGVENFGLLVTPIEGTGR